APKPVPAPLAAGAVSPLLKDVPIVVPVAESAPPIINPAEPRDDVKLTKQSPSSLSKELDLLLAERASWGTEPSVASASPYGGAPYPNLTTSSLDDLLAQRAGWGAGALAANVSQSTDVAGVAAYPILESSSLDALLSQRTQWGVGEAKAAPIAPLAAGAVTPLPLSAALPVETASTTAADPIINPLEPSPPVELSVQPQKALNQQLASLLKERESWVSGASLSDGVSKPAVPSEPTRVAALGDPDFPTATSCDASLKVALSSGKIEFNTGRADLNTSSTATLDRLSSVAKSCGDVKISIEGHTDSAGRRAMNQRLSEARAAAVSDYLIKSGVPADRLSVIGYGETKPLVPNTSRANKAKNRRIEFSVQ
ncbi:MAG: OmpA family protein, partial [Pseudomonadota bacterium]